MLRAAGDRWIYGWTLNDGWLKPNGLSSQPLPPQPGAAPDGDLVRTAVLSSVPKPGRRICAARSQAAVEERIARIQNGIVPPVLVTGETPQKLTLADLMKQLHVPGVSIAVIHDGQIDWARGFGVTGIGGAPVNAETLFQAASISKPVTALIALRLAQAGKFDLDVDANTYLKSWKIPAERIRRRSSRYGAGASDTFGWHRRGWVCRLCRGAADTDAGSDPERRRSRKFAADPCRGGTGNTLELFRRRLRHTSPAA